MTRLIILIIRIQMSQTDEKSLNMKLLAQFMASITMDEGYVRHMGAASSLFRINLKTCPESIYQSALRIKERQERLDERPEKSGETSSSDGVSCWAMNQQKLFYWVALSYCYSRSIIPYTIKIEEIGPIQAIFANKMADKLLFELRILTCNKNRQDNWTQEEDDLLREVAKEEVKSMEIDSNIKWKFIAYEIFRRSSYRFFKSPRQTRQRWINHINPVLLKNQWTVEEDLKLFELLRGLGPKWALISKKMGAQRTEHMVKNRVNSIIKKIFKRRPRNIKENHIAAVFVFLQGRKAKSQHMSSASMDDGDSIKAKSYSPISPTDNGMFSEEEEKMEVEVKIEEEVVLEQEQLYSSRLQQGVKYQQNYKENTIYDILTLPKTVYFEKLVANFESQEEWLNRFRSSGEQSWFQQ